MPQVFEIRLLNYQVMNKFEKFFLKLYNFISALKNQKFPDRHFQLSEKRFNYEMIKSGFPMLYSQIVIQMSLVKRR